MIKLTVFAARRAGSYRIHLCTDRWGGVRLAIGLTTYQPGETLTQYSTIHDPYELARMIEALQEVRATPKGEASYRDLGWQGDRSARSVAADRGGIWHGCVKTTWQTFDWVLEHVGLKEVRA